MSDHLLAIGTKKGLFLARSSDGLRWEPGELLFPMNAVYAVSVDPRLDPPRLLVSAASEHWGPTVLISDDLGKTWAEPDRAALAFPSDTGASVERVWQLAPSPAEPDVVWAGTEPSALWRSDDGGSSFSLVRALWDHPHRPNWGAGYGGQAIHTILPHPTDPRRVLVAMSTGGVYRSDDGGANWEPANRGVGVPFLPDPPPEYGQCVHKVARDSADPERLYLQNHHGVYRSDDGGTEWTSIADGLPTDFGFAVVSSPIRGDTAFTAPVADDGLRVPPENALRIYRSDDAGASWTALDKGLPREPYFGIVLRDALTSYRAGDATGIAFGTRNGDVFASIDDGESWSTVAEHLPDVLCVRAAASA
jgi:photosystem II stability/assembly factor-like uncharacterized protein